MPKSRYAAESNSDLSLVPVLLFTLVVVCLYAFDIGILELVLKAIQRFSYRIGF
jgi:hypothetical protein